jgi:hypothetical protein
MARRKESTDGTRPDSLGGFGLTLQQPEIDATAMETMTRLSDRTASNSSP